MSGGADSTRSARIGARVGDWVLERALGQGGMGAVFEARHVETGALRALKLLSSRDAVARERFAREARALARFGRHPSIVGIDATGETEAGEPYLVLELVTGESLEARLARGPLAVEDATRVARDIAAALAAVHAHGLVHRDLKPGNVLLRPDGGAVLTDFGIARDDAEARLTASQALLGTPEFMAPEQIAPGLGVVGPATDVFALGALLWATLTGQSPFQGETIIEVVHRITEAEIPSASGSRGDVPPDLDALIGWCLERDIAARPPADVVAAALGRLARGEPAGLPPGRGRARRRARRGPLRAAGAVVLALGALLALVELDRRLSSPATSTRGDDPRARPASPGAQPPSPSSSRPPPRERRLLAALLVEGPARVAAWREACQALRESPGDPALGELRARLEVLAARPLLVITDAAPPGSNRAWVTPLDDRHALVTAQAAREVRLIGLDDGRARGWSTAPGGAGASAPVCLQLGSGGGVAVLACSDQAESHSVYRAALTPGGAGSPATAARWEEIATPGDAVVAMTATADGRRIAAGGAFPGLAVLEVGEGAAARWLDTPRAGKGRRVRALASSPDGRLLAVGGAAGADDGRSPGWVAVHHLDGGRDPVVADTSVVSAVRFGRKGGLVCSAAHLLLLVDPETGLARPTTGPMEPPPYGDAFMRDLDVAGDSVWTAGDALLVAWRWGGGEDLPVIAERRPRAGPQVASARLTPDGALLLIGTASPATVEVWGASIPR